MFQDEIEKVEHPAIEQLKCLGWSYIPGTALAPVLPTDGAPEGERGYLFLERGAKTRAFLKGRTQVTFSDIAALAVPILSHRIGFQYVSKEKDRLAKAEELISCALEKVVTDVARGL